MTDAGTRARVHDALAKKDFTLPDEVRNSPPLVTWHHEGCRKRVLRLYLTPAGWFLLSERFPEKLDDWLERVGLNREEYDEAVVTDAQRVQGQRRVLPLDTSLWPQGTFEVGCARHKIGRVDLALLRADADKARATRRSNRRSISA